jgi:protein required for attachment to host cells
MQKLSVPHDAWVFVGDGQKALFLRNAGDAQALNLVTESVFADADPPTHEQGTDRPGRTFNSAVPTEHSSVETTDWHRLAKDRFADHVAAALERLVRAKNVKAIVVVAPPRTLAELRHAFHVDVKRRIIAEIGKDLTRHPIWDIEKHLVA